jgi:hypothetical protein
MKQYETALPEKEKVDDAAAETAFTNKRNAPFEEYSTKAKSMVDKEKNRLSEGKEQDFYMSLIEGGLAAAGATGPNGIQNIAQGFSKGAASYKDALKDFRKASQENAKMELDIDKATAAQKIGNIDQWEKRTEAAKERNAKRDQYAASGLSQLLSHDISGKYAYAGQSLAANTQLQAYGMPGAQERMVERFSTDPKFAAAYKEFASIVPNVKGDAAWLAQYSGPKGEIALKMLESGTPAEKQQAAMIRQQLMQHAMRPMDAPLGGGPIRP